MIAFNVTVVGGELGAGGATVTVTVDGWKSIAAAIGRSVRWCQTMAERSTEPMPVFRLGGRVRARLTDLEAWLHEECERSMRARAQQRAATRTHLDDVGDSTPAGSNPAGVVACSRS